MIVTCPSCTTRFLVSSSALMPDGRYVRCSVCKEVWHQEPEDTDGDQAQQQERFSVSLDQEAEELEIDFVEALEEANSEAADETPEKAPSEQASQVPPENSSQYMAALTGYAAAALLSLACVVFLFLFHETIKKTWPPSEAFYQIFGYEKVVPGEGLFFEQLRAVQTSQKLRITGQVVNIRTDRSVDLPPVLITLLSQDENILERIIVPFSTGVIPAGQVQRFEKTVTSVPEETWKIRLRFAAPTEAPLIKKSANDALSQ